MKKILMACAAIALATTVEAAVFNWSSSSVAYGVNAASVVFNGDYTAGTTKMRNNGTWSYVLSLFESGTDNLIGTASGTINVGSTGKISTSNITIGDAAALTTYDYVLALTGTQTGLTDRGIDGGYDYSAAYLSTTIDGSVTTVNAGNTTLSTAAPSTWAVAGITVVPEPTSGLLLLVGMAGLALRRKRA